MEKKRSQLVHGGDHPLLNPPCRGVDVNISAPCTARPKAVLEWSGYVGVGVTPCRRCQKMFENLNAKCCFTGSENWAAEGANTFPVKE